MNTIPRRLATITVAGLLLALILYYVTMLCLQLEPILAKKGL